MRISVCIITKNESVFLEKCLASVKPIADEIIVADTGSSDDTKTIAKSFGATVKDVPWTDDFAAARNASMKDATGDWIFVIDADEVLDAESVAKIRERVNGQAEGYYVIQRTYTNDSSMPGWTAHKQEEFNGYYDTSLVRLFRNKGYVWRFKVHEQIEQSILEKEGSLEKSSIVLHHYRERKGKTFAEEKKELYTTLSEKESQTTGDAKNFYDSGVGYHQKNPEKAAQLYTQALARDPGHVKAAVNLSYLLLNAGHVEKALVIIDKALEYHKDIALYNNKVAACIKLSRFDEAKKICDVILAKDSTNTEALMNKAFLLIRERDYDGALRLYDAIIEINPEKKEAYLNKVMLYVTLKEEEKTKDAIAAAQKKFPHDPMVETLVRKFS